MAAVRAQQVKKLEKVLLGIRTCSVEKLQQLNSEFIDHQDWLRQTIADTRDHKDALGLVCPRTTRKVTKAKGILAKAQEAEASNKEDQENIENGATKQPKKGRGRTTKVPLAESVPEADDLSVFDPEEVSDAESESQPNKKAKGKKGGKQASKKEKSEQIEEAPKEQAGSVVEAERQKLPEVDHKAELQKLKVVEIRAQLQEFGLPMNGSKSDLVERLNAAMIAEDFRADTRRKKLMIGRDVRPVLGMRVVHVLGTDHGSSRGMYGIIEYIPGRGAQNLNEKSVSVRWMADLSDVRGPYYTGEACDRGSGVGDAKFDLYCLDDVEQDVFPESDILGLQAEELDTGAPTKTEKTVEVEQLKVEEVPEEPVSVDSTAVDAPDQESTPIVEETPQRATKKRSSEKSPVNEPLEKKRKSSPPPPAPEPQNEESSAGAKATALMQKLGEVRQAWGERTATATPAPVASIAPAPVSETPAASKDVPQATPPATESTCPVLVPALRSATPEADTSSVSSLPSVQQFRAILARIHSGNTPTVEPASTPSSTLASARVSAPRVLSTHKPMDQTPEVSAGGVISHPGSNKSGTWPLATPQQSYKASDPFGNDQRGSRERSSGQGYSILTSEALSAHVQSQGKVDPMQMMNKGQNSGPTVPKVLDVRVSQQATHAIQQQRLMDAASRQQRAAENRARMEDEKKKMAVEAEKKKKEAEQKRAEQERIANERRQKEIQEQAQRAEAARLRALQEEERKMRAAAEEEQRRQQREREMEKARAAQEAAQAQAQAQAKPAVPLFAGLGTSSPHLGGGNSPHLSAPKGIFGAIGGAITKVAGSVFGGQEPVQQPAQLPVQAPKVFPKETGPTSIQIQMEKNSDESDEDEDEERKQQPPLWARSPNLRIQIDAQENLSPSTIFGECKKTCDLGHIFQHHQPKRRKYDKRTSSADWGDVDGRASYMEEERFQRHMIQNMAMQQAGKSKY